MGMLLYSSMKGHLSRTEKAAWIAPSRAVKGSLCSYHGAGGIEQMIVSTSLRLVRRCAADQLHFEFRQGLKLVAGVLVYHFIFEPSSLLWW